MTAILLVGRRRAKVTPEQRFEILEELGRGGMGIVYRARDRESGREVALKVVLQQLDARRLERFRREGEITARLAHTGIVRIHSSGMREGRPYLAYELVQGRDLGEVLREVELGRRVALIRDTSRALGYAHARGVIHRDVKPENVLVDAEGRVHVADFGLATAQDLERLTLTGATLGTPSHMSPEQIGGDSKELGPPTDVWALGVILYEALTGQLPFEMGSNMAELAGKIITADVEHPRSIDATVPRALEAICLKALARLPLQRYADANALADDLDAYLGGQRSGLGRAAASRRMPLVLVGSAIVLLALGLLAVALALQPIEPEVVTTPAPEPKEPAPLRPGEVSSARHELEKALLLEAPRRHAELTRWLGANPRHPDRARAKEEQRRAQLEFPVHVFDHYRAGGRNVAFVSAYFVDEQRVVTRGWDRVFLWDLAAPAEPIWELELDALGSGLAVEPGGAHIVLGKAKGAWVARVGGKELRALPGFPAEAGVSRVAFSADGRRLAVATTRHGIHLFSWPGCQLSSVIPRNFARALALSDDGLRVVAGGGGWMDVHLEKVSEDPDFFGVWEVNTGRALVSEDRGAPPSAVAFSPDGRYAVAGDTVGTVFAIELETLTRQEFVAQGSKEGMTPLYASTGHLGELVGLAFTPDGAGLISAGKKRGSGAGESELKFWDFAAREEQRKVPLAFPPYLMTCSPGRTRVLLGSIEGGKVELHVAQVQ